MVKRLPYRRYCTQKIYKAIVLSCICLLCAFSGKANNIQVVSPEIVDHNNSGTAYVKFDLFWEHSWNDNMRGNWDAAWVFVKSYHKDLREWSHVYLDTTSSSHSYSSANVPMSMSFEAENLMGFRRCPGFFIHRKDPGNGSNEIQGLKIKFNYLDHGYSPTDTIVVSVFAIEMIYIPGNKFVIGDGVSINTLKKTGNAISVGTGQKKADLEYIESETGLFFTTEAVSDNYPKGTLPFYIMKHEISQHAYVDFLNTLNADQQRTRTSILPTTAAKSFAMPSAGFTSNPAQYRNYIKIRSSANDEVPALYGHSIDNVLWNKEDNGGNIACNFLNWSDGLAYLDWAALRPFTELEYEKACRGHKKVVTAEYAWAYKAGNPVLNTNSFTDPGLATEEARDITANYLETGKAPWVMRVGAFAKDSSTRYEAGATFYGVMNMSDNLWERCVNFSTKEGRAFKPQNGNGEVTIFGAADVLEWPASKGGGFRGFQVSSRQYADLDNDTRHPSYGFRGARNAPKQD